MGREWLYEIEQLEAERLRPSELGRFEQGMFHLTARALDDLHCFSDRQDKGEFLARFARHLSTEPQRDPNRRRMFPSYRGEASLVAYCLLDNHYHLLIRQFSIHGTMRLMRSVLGSYGKYFNAKYGRENVPVFREAFTATKINGSRQGKFAMGYVTLNHEVKRDKYEFSSHDYYLGRRRTPGWLDVNSGLWFFDGERDKYAHYIATEGMAALENKIANRAAKQSRPATRAIRRGIPSHINR
ncbi:MAG: hypothetical protein HYX29_11420 [Solirubrobacterales bacterium]|nr:hypothetical protein [Solirubrobacterales bacterium]